MFPTECPVCKHNTLALEGYDLVCGHCNVYRQPLNVLQTVVAWARGRNGMWRAAVLVWVVYVYIQNLRDSQFALDRLGNVFSAIDLGIHELGHVLFMPFGQFLTLVGGSLFQIVFPLMWAVALYCKKWYFAAAMCLCWLGFSFMDVAAYAADARTRALPLVSLSSEYDATAHDWYQILSRLDALQHDAVVAGVLRVLGHVSVGAGLLLGVTLAGYMLYYRIISSDNKDDAAY